MTLSTTELRPEWMAARPSDVRVRIERRASAASALRATKPSFSRLAIVAPIARGEIRSCQASPAVVMGPSRSSRDRAVSCGLLSSPSSEVSRTRRLNAPMATRSRFAVPRTPAPRSQSRTIRRLSFQSQVCKSRLLVDVRME